MSRLEELWATEPWRAEAECARHPEVDFLPRAYDIASVNAAKAICAECVVIDECFEYVMELPDNPVGVWAGLSYNQRKHLRRNNDG